MRGRSVGWARIGLCVGVLSLLLVPLGLPTATAATTAAIADTSTTTADTTTVTDPAIAATLPTAAPTNPPGRPAEESPPSVPSIISLEPEELYSMTLEEIERVAVGDPEVLDITIVSADKLLLQGKSIGTTNLILWDRQGQHTAKVEVIDRTPIVVEGQLRELLDRMDLSQVRVERKGSKLFLTGEVSREEDLDRLDGMLAAFEEPVTNLVARATLRVVSPTETPLVELTVQLVEMLRNDADKIGVSWSDSITLTETAFGVQGPTGASRSNRLAEAFRLGALSRTGIIATLNLLTTEGKARILAEPKLVAASGKEAKTILGVEVPVLTATNVSQGTVTQNIEFKNTGVELTFLPTVLEDGHTIQLVISTKVSSVDKAVAIVVSGVSVPGFRVRESQTEIIVGSGESVIIAGLLQDEEKETLSRVPGISNIPVLGALFRSTELTYDLTELVIIVTPEVLTGRGAVTERARPLEQTLTGVGERRAEALPRVEPLWVEPSVEPLRVEPPRVEPRAEDVASVDRPPSGGYPGSVVDDPRLKYALQVQARIAQAIRYPVNEQGQLSMSGLVKLRLRVTPDGTLEQIELLDSSGIEALDREALSAAEAQSPYPPFPPSLAEQQELWLELPVLFRQ